MARSIHFSMAWKVCFTTKVLGYKSWWEVRKKRSSYVEMRRRSDSFPSYPGSFPLSTCSLLTPTGPSRLFSVGKVVAFLSAILVPAMRLMWMSAKWILIVGAVWIRRVGGG